VRKFCPAFDRQPDFFFRRLRARGPAGSKEHDMKAWLVLEDGKLFNGRSFGAQGEVTAEVVFNTGMSGYQEILTDPSYRGQIVNMTYPLIGNYGVNPEDSESDRIQVAGFVVRELCRAPSNFRSRGTLEAWLAAQGVLGIEGVDTRALTRHIREAGSMNGILTTREQPVENLRAKAAAAPHMAGLDLVQPVTCAAPWVVNPDAAPGSLEVTLIDCGAKHNIHRELAQRGCRVRIVPARTSAEEILAFNPDGVQISNGPGDPAVLDYLIATVRGLLGQVPVFGICLGHQILGLALGGRTSKMKFGHRGINHPVLELATGRTSITSQNHGFCVEAESLPPGEVEITHVNLNDNSVEGLRHKRLPAFSVQYHPEASPGPNDAKDLFDRFIIMMKENRK
jgi:carbamoyl-phosphate synthase small subunit